MYCYVLFVKTGYEYRVADEISCNWQIEDAQPFVPMYDACFRKAGKVFLEKRQLIPGYVFIESSERGQEFYLSVVNSIRYSEHSLKLLRNGYGYKDSSFEMARDDYALLKKLIGHDSCIEISQGFIEETNTIVTNGPLTGLEWLIKRVNRHKMEATIDIGLMGAIREMTVGLEILHRLP